jgi:hypothetical protein
LASTFCRFSAPPGRCAANRRRGVSAAFSLPRWAAAKRRPQFPGWSTPQSRRPSSLPVSPPPRVGCRARQTTVHPLPSCRPVLPCHSRHPHAPWQPRPLHAAPPTPPAPSAACGGCGFACTVVPCLHPPPQRPFPAAPCGPPRHGTACDRAAPRIHMNRTQA